MTISNVLTSHAQLVEDVVWWYGQGWISEREKLRYLISLTEVTEDYLDHLVKELH